MSALALLIPGASTAAAETCFKVRTMVVRGTSEPSGWSINLDGPDGANSPNSTAKLIRAELENPTDGSVPIASGDIDRTDLDYPAAIPVPPYYDDFRVSVREGTLRLVRWIHDRNLACPDTRFILLGYSQGAIIVGNAVSHRYERMMMGAAATDPMLNSAEFAKVAAVGMFADGGYVNNELIFGQSTVKSRAVHASGQFTSGPTFVLGTKDDLNRGRNDSVSTTNDVGYFNSRVPGALDRYAFGKVRNYCILQDPVCRSGSGALEAHLYYAGDIEAHRNLAIFSVQQLRNQIRKSVPATCSLLSRTGGTAGYPTTYAAQLALNADVDDRAAPGGPMTVSGVSSTLAFASGQTTNVRTLLGSPATVRANAYLRLHPGTVGTVSNTTTGLTDAFLNVTAATPTTVAPNPLATAPTQFPLTPASTLSLTLPGNDPRQALSKTWTAPPLTGSVADGIDLTLAEIHLTLTGSNSVVAVLDCLANNPDHAKLGRFSIAPDPVWSVYEDEENEVPKQP